MSIALNLGKEPSTGTTKYVAEIPKICFEDYQKALGRFQTQ